MRLCGLCAVLRKSCVDAVVLFGRVKLSLRLGPLLAAVHRCFGYGTLPTANMYECSLRDGGTVDLPYASPHVVALVLACAGWAWFPAGLSLPVSLPVNLSAEKNPKNVLVLLHLPNAVSRVWNTTRRSPDN